MKQVPTPLSRESPLYTAILGGKFTVVDGMPFTSLGIISEQVHPPIAALTEVLEGTHGPGPLDLTLNPPQSSTVATYGMKIVATVIPAAWGLQVGNPNIYQPPFLQLTPGYLSAGGITPIFVNPVRITINNTVYFWDEAAPAEVLAHIQPGWTLVFTWLQT